MGTLTKLARKLPRIALPTALPNGGAAQWPIDPYLETVVNGSPWTQGNSGFINASHARTNGIVHVSGVGYQTIFLQSFSALTGIPKVYVEIEEIRGGLWVYDSSTIITEPGAYIIDFDTPVTVGQIGYYLPDAYFSPDPYFKLVPVGVLGTVNAENQYLTTGTRARKDTNGRLYLNAATTAGGQLMKYYNSWTGSQDVDIEVAIDYIPPGGSLAIMDSTGTMIVNNITSPGRYTARATFGAAAFPTLVNLSQVLGEIIVSKFFVKRSTQQWVIEGDQFSKPTALWMASREVFDRIINPQTLVASNQYQFDNLAAACQPFGPQLGVSGYLPPAGLYRAGDTIYNPSGSPSGWRCIAAGNPGTWAPLANL